MRSAASQNTGIEQPEQAEQPRAEIEGAVAEERRDDAEGNRDHDRQQHREQGQLDGDGQPLQEHLPHRKARAE